MERRSDERLLPRDFRDVRSVELADGRDDRTRYQGVRGSVGSSNPNCPRCGALVPCGAEHFGIEPDMGFDTVSCHHSIEIGVELRLLREELRPLVAWLEAIAVEVIADVDSSARVRVFEPRAADARILLDDGERDAGLLEADTGEEARLTTADHHDRERLACREFGRDCAASSVRPVEFELLEEHWNVVRGYGFAGQPLHHLQEEVS
jgi:hypothetical protein